MQAFTKMNLGRNILSLIVLFLCIFQAKSQTVHDINVEVKDFPDYKKAEFSQDPSDLYYFKHSIATMPSSRVMAFRFVFDEFDQTFKNSKILCTSVADTTSDEDLKNALNALDETTSSCIGDFNEEEDLGIYDGIIKLDKSKTKMGIKLQVSSVSKFSARIFLKIEEETLETKEQLVTLDQTHSIVASTVVITSFRPLASKLLFYSLTRELQMYYVEGDKPYPERLFSGNVLLVYTNPNMVRQKYKNANTMVLLSRPFSKSEVVSENFNYQVKFFNSQYALDYFLSNNPNGRSKNTPLMINMTTCEQPYYVVLNYNQKEKKTALYIDQVYGKVTKLSIATSFGENVMWEDMVDNMEEIRASDRYYELPANRETHIDVYKVECQIPILLNFYYVDEKEKKPDLNYGNVVIFKLKSYETVQLNYASDVLAPVVSIEVFNPIKLPMVIINDGVGEGKLISKNELMKITPMNTLIPLVIKERQGDTSTRIIVKVGYKLSGAEWKKINKYISYNQNLKIFVYSFPNEDDRFNYTYTELETIGKTEGDNIKYCFATSIGVAIVPSAENCYRVSLDNPYTLKVVNPLIIYKDYDFPVDVGYYVSIKPVNEDDEMDVKNTEFFYDTTERNLEGQTNIIEINTAGEAYSILSAPAGKDAKLFFQVTQCAKKQITVSAKDAFNGEITVLNDTDIKDGEINFYRIVDNPLLETEIKATGDVGTKVFIRHAGIRDGYNLDIIENPSIVFNQTTNEIILEHPINSYERIDYTVYIGKKGEILDKEVTLCSVALDERIGRYAKTTTGYGISTTMSINFENAGLKPGEEFDGIVYYELQYVTKMAFLSKVFTGIVGDVPVEAVTEIKTQYEDDPNIVYATGKATSEGRSIYFSFTPEEIRDVPVGAFRIEFENEYEKTLSGVYCAFVDVDASPASMIEEVEDIKAVGNPYCIGGKSITHGKLYNYLFRYDYTDDLKPKKLVIKVTNNQHINDGFNIYLRKGNNTYIEPTDFVAEKTYGEKEEYQKTLMPYIIDLDYIRGEDKNDYVSKLLIYSRYFEMQMFYLDSTQGEDRTNMPILLFTGGIMLVYTNTDLAEQKYHGKKLILLSENLNGQEHTILGNSFRFHTKMFKSDDQIEFFMSNNPTGRTLNYPLSLEINTCNVTAGKDKYYYILNYNRQEDETILYLDLIYGLMKNARAITRIFSNTWSELIENDMTDLEDMQITLGEISQHIDVIEIECKTPLLANAFYNKPNEEYKELSNGNIAIKTLDANGTFSIGVDPYLSGVQFVEVSLYNRRGNADISVRYGSSNPERLVGNVMKMHLLTSNPKTISISNNNHYTAHSKTRVIVKLGFGVEGSWHKEETIPKINGELYSDQNRFVYKFPSGDSKLNFTSVDIKVKPLRKGSEPEEANIKFCYSSSLGMAIDASQENCFRTGAKIPYTLHFVNPFIAPKIYDLFVDNYYVTLSPNDASKRIQLEFTENKYDIQTRGKEGVHTVLTLDEEENKNGILLSIPSESYFVKTFVQLDACVAQKDSIEYKAINAFSKEEINKGTIIKDNKFFYFELDNNKMETQINFKGEVGDKVFIKHMGITDTQLVLEEYSSTWVEDKNSVSIIKPIKNNEAFNITVLVGKKDSFKDFTLCTFAETSPEDYDDLGDYVATFPSTSSDIVSHFVDFSQMKDYKVGTEFDLLVYAVQINKMKIEVLYSVIPGKVGKVEGIDEINGLIPDKNDYVTHLFSQNTTSNNYLYYNFKDKPEGDIASMKIFTQEGQGKSVSKVACTLVKSGASPEEMIKAVNEAERNSNNLCVGETFRDDSGFDALVNMKNYSTTPQLVILVKYGFAEEIIKNGNTNEEVILNITLRKTGLKVTRDGEFKQNEDLTLIPYVFDLKEIRDMGKENYNSKVLIYSSTREMDMYYLENGAPKTLFSGNIMMVYTNEEVIKEKYNGASTMILITDSLEKYRRPPFGEKFRFKVSFYDSKKSIQYYVSANPHGRPLNNPTAIEMLSCEQPYYYILNYHYTERDRMLHIDTIFGEINSTKFADQLTALDWDTFVSEMDEFVGDEYSIKGQDKYHIDVFEVKCNTPLLLNIYYTDERNPHQTNLKQGDISILTLHPNSKDSLSFIEDLSGQSFLYTFNVHRRYGAPNILIDYDQRDTQTINKNGIFVQNTTENYKMITVYNKQLTGEDTTKVIFKFGYNIEETFTKIQNDMYNLQDKNRTENLFAYIFKHGEDRLNYTKVDFKVTTESDNVKFCYSTNLGAFINPSTQNCFRVGKKNSYTITVMNPYIMYKNYYTGNDVMEYFVSFKTVDKDLNITITPTLKKYDTTNRNMPEVPNKITIKNSEKTILTNPENQQYLFVQMDVCTPNTAIRYEFKNAFSGESLQEKGEINAKSKNKYKNILNTKLDTELFINTDNKDVNMFIKHTGLKNKFLPNVKKIDIVYKDKKLNFTQPIAGEEFAYSIFIDKRGNIQEKSYTLCDFALPGKKAYYTAHVTSAEKQVIFDLDFDTIKDLEGYEDFEALILAEEVNNGKMMILSDIYSPNGGDEPSSGTNTALIVIIIVLAIVCVAGGIAVFIYVRKLKNKPKGAIVSQPTDDTDIEGAESGQKLVESMAQSVAVEHQ